MPNSTPTPGPYGPGRTARAYANAGDRVYYLVEKSGHMPVARKVAKPAARLLLSDLDRRPAGD